MPFHKHESQGKKITVQNLLSMETKSYRKKFMQ